jgi:hypothetical protein
MADCSQEQTIFCLNVISNSKGLLFLIYAPHQYFTHYGSAYVQLKGIQILTICLISKGLLFFDTPCIATRKTKDFLLMGYVYEQLNEIPCTVQAALKLSLIKTCFRPVSLTQSS